MNFFAGLFLTALLWLGQQVSAQDDALCFADGECVGSLVLREFTVDNPQACLEACRSFDNVPSCHSFNYYMDDGLCVLLANCPDVSINSCSNCYIGRDVCPDLECGLVGTCLGNFLEQEFAENPQVCLDDCRANEQCRWFEYNFDDQSCIQLADCVNIFDTCNSCIVGRDICGNLADNIQPQLEFTKIMIVGGQLSDGTTTNNAYAFDMETGKNCNLQFFEDPVEHTTGAFIRNGAKICGGDDSSPSETRYCWDFVPNGFWDIGGLMTTTRSRHAASSSGRINYIMSGGDTVAAAGSTEYWQDEEEAFQPGPDMPIPLTDHCQVTLGGNRIFIGGGQEVLGQDDWIPNLAAFIIDFDNGEVITLPPMTMERNFAACGFTRGPNGDEVVVAGGGTAEILNLESLEWREGPAIPDDFDQGAGVIQRADTFLVVGGQTLAGELSSAIWRFDPQNESWTAEISLPFGRRYHSATAISEASIPSNCQF